MAYFPDPTRNTGNLRYKRFYEKPQDWGAVTDEYEFEDAGRDFNERSGSAPREWEVVFGPLTKTQADQFDTFWNTYKKSGTFDFQDKYGTTWNGVRIKSYDRIHEAHKSWRITVTFNLVLYP